MENEMTEIWKVTHYGKEKTVAVHNQEGECIAVCNSSTADNEANALLIASAPEQAETIRKLREKLHQYIDNFDNQLLDNEQVKEWLDDYWIPEVRAILAETEQK